MEKAILVKKHIATLENLPSEWVSRYGMYISEDCRYVEFLRPQAVTIKLENVTSIGQRAITFYLMGPNFCATFWKETTLTTVDIW